MMNEPGMSLFQGTESIKINAELEREEEEEFLQEEEKRKAELQNLIQKGFDDLIDDDYEDDLSTLNSSQGSNLNETESEYHKLPDHGRNNLRHINFSECDQEMCSSKNVESNQSQKTAKKSYGGEGKETDVSTHYQHCFRSSPLYQRHNLDNDLENAFKKTDSESLEQLQVLYEIRLREIEKLNLELEGEKDDKQKMIEHLTSLESQKEGALLGCQQSQELLVSCRERILELENEVANLKLELLENIKAKDEANKKLEIEHLQISHLKETVIAMERCDAGINREKQMDALIKSLNAQHEREKILLRQQLDSAVSKLNQKEIEYNALGNKFEELEKKHSTILLNKCDLAVRQDSMIQKLLEEANQEKLELNKKFFALQAECDLLKKDLDQVDRVNKYKLLAFSSSDEHDSDSIIHLGIGNLRNESKKLSMSHTDLMNKLKDELHRSLLSQKAKRNEIKRLQEDLKNKELQIYKMEEKERIYLEETESLKAEIEKIMHSINNNKSYSFSKDQEEIIMKYEKQIHDLQNKNKHCVEKILSLESGMVTKNINDQANKNEHLDHNHLIKTQKEVDRVINESEESFFQKKIEWENKFSSLLKENNEYKQKWIEIKTSKDKLLTSLEEEKKKKKCPLD